MRLAHRVILPVLQTQAWSCLLKGLLVLRPSATQSYLSCKLTGRSCLLKGLLILQPSAAHRVTCLANSRPGLSAQGITGLATLSSLTGSPILQTHGLQLAVCSANSFAESSISDRPCFQFRNRSRCSCERFWSSSPQGVIRRFSPLGLGGLALRRGSVECSLGPRCRKLS